MILSTLRLTLDLKTFFGLICIVIIITGSPTWAASNSRRRKRRKRKKKRKRILRHFNSNSTRHSWSSTLAWASLKFRCAISERSPHTWASIMAWTLNLMRKKDYSTLTVRVRPMINCQTCRWPLRKTQTRRRETTKKRRCLRYRKVVIYYKRISTQRIICLAFSH